MTTEEKYRETIEEILLQMQYDPRAGTIPEWFVKTVANIIKDHGITILSYEPGQSLGITTDL